MTPVDPVVPTVENAPEYLSGDEGETVFIRCDLALSATHARGYALAIEGRSLAGYEVDIVAMLPVPEHFTNVDADWWTVKDDTPGAVRYWRFRV